MSSHKPTILITAAGGHIGTQLVPQLLKEHCSLVLPTSNAQKLQSTLPESQGIHIEEGSIQDPQWLGQILEKHGVDTVFLNLTGTDELMTTLNFLDTMQRSGSVKNLVYLSAAGDFADTQEGFRDTVSTHSAAHVLVKPIIESKLLFTDYPWTTTRLGPTLFWDNDLRSKDYIMSGYFDEPLGETGMSRVSTEDIAVAAKNALLDGQRWDGKKIMIGSLKRYSGAETVKFWSEGLGKEVKMCPSTEQGFEEFEEEFFKKAKDRAWARDLRLMYEPFAVHGFGMTEHDYKLQVECLGREPRDYVEFVRSTAKAWSSS